MLSLLAKYKLAVIGVALLGALGLGGVGVAAANGALPFTALSLLQRASTATPGATPTAAHQKAASAIIHGTVILSASGSWVAYTLDVGIVASASSSAITLTHSNQSQVTLTVSSSTLWGKNGKTPKDFSKLSGRQVAILSQNGAAVHVGGLDLFKDVAYADLTIAHNGKTREVQLDRGTVQAISATQISLTRADGVAVTETLAPKVRYQQRGVKGPAQASAVTSGATVTLVIANNQVIAIRIAAAQTA